MIDCFHVVDGQIMSIRVYYDPRPILEGMSRARLRSHPKTPSSLLTLSGVITLTTRTGYRYDPEVGLILSVKSVGVISAVPTTRPEALLVTESNCYAFTNETIQFQVDAADIVHD